MSDLILLQPSSTEPVAETEKPKIEEMGTLKTEACEHSVSVFTDTEESTRAVSEFLQQANDPSLKEGPDLERVIVPLEQEMHELETEMTELNELLSHAEAPSQPNPKEKIQETKQDNLLNLIKEKVQNKQENVVKQEKPQTPIRHDSLFSLARDFHTKAAVVKSKLVTATSQQKKSETSSTKITSHPHFDEHRKAALHSAFEKKEIRPSFAKNESKEKEREGKQQQEQKGREGKQQQEQKGSPFKKFSKLRQAGKNNRAIQRIGASTGVQKEASVSTGEQLSVDSIYVRFMALMARILGQAEAEAHKLYVTVKERTDSIDLLTLLTSKVNSEKKEIDWTQNEEMKSLIDKVRALGVDIPEGKLKWSEDEKRLLKENIQMRKDSLEKMTQLERTDMQRYMQEVSQCHQARSNVLKMMKEVLDTIIHNMRGG